MNKDALPLLFLSSGVIQHTMWRRSQNLEVAQRLVDENRQTICLTISLGFQRIKINGYCFNDFTYNLSNLSSLKAW